MNIGFIGTGNMGGAILKGYATSSPQASENTLLAFRRDKEKLQDICRATGALPCESIEEAACRSDILFLGVKPQNFEEVLPQVKAGLDQRASQVGTNNQPDGTNDQPVAAPCVVSMAAGVTIASMEQVLGEATKIIRIMPNTPCAIGQGMISLSRNGKVTDEEAAEVTEILSAVGAVAQVPEDVIHTVIGVSGSSPAYTYMYIEALIRAAVAHGMDEETAKVFAANAVKGAADMVLQSADSPEQLRINVCSPGGTTIEAVNYLMEAGFQDTVEAAFDAAVRRSREMAAESEK